MNLATPAVTIKPNSYAPDSAAVAADLRTLAGVIEDNPVLASLIKQAFDGSLFPIYAAAEEHRDAPRELLVDAVRQLKPIATGPIEKRYIDKWFEANIPLQAITLRLTEHRDAVCTRVVTGTETVTEEIPDPAYIAAAPKITQTREVEKVEWKCEPLMAPSPAAGAA